MRGGDQGEARMAALTAGIARPDGRHTVAKAGGDAAQRTRFRFGALAGALLAAIASTEPAAAQTAAPDAIFTVGNYPVDATAENAVAAKQKALADGQQAALRSLFKRLVPVTAYNRLAKLKAIKAADLVDGVSVRSERNSTTRYIASLDFTFSPGGVRTILQREGIPFIEQQAQPVVLVPILVGANGAEAPGASQARTWSDLWASLDLERSLSPLKLAPPAAAPAPDVVRALMAGDMAAIAPLARESRSDLVIAALAEPDRAAGRINVTLIGQDAVGPLHLKRRYRVEDGDVDYALEYAAVVSLGIVEGRWKARAVQSRGGLAVLSGPADAVEVVVEFASRAQWTDMRRQLDTLPGIQGIEVMSLSARNAVLSLRYPGGAAQLASAVSARGLSLADAGGTWVLRPGR
jgi:hypothetical protein